MKRYLISCILIIVGLIACQKTGTNPDPDPGGSNTIKLSLAADKLISNSAIGLSLTVKGEPDTLELLVNNKVEATLSAPYTYSFKPATEGNFTVIAQAKKGTKTVKSNALSLIIDRTPPSIVSRTPEPDSSVSSTAIQVNFSEALDSSTITASTIQVTDIRKGLLVSSATIDGTQLSINLTDTPLTPTSLKLELNNLKDLAGNSLSTSWSWSVPGSSSFSSLALLGERSISSDKTIKENPSRIAADDAGHIAVVWLEGKTVKVKIWTGTAWQVLTDIPSSKEPFRPDIALLNNGNPVVAWQKGTETDIGQGDIEVVSWNGLSWDSLGTVDTPGFDAAAPALAVDKTDKITVTWFEYDGSSSNVRVKQYDGLTWTALGDVLDNLKAHIAAYPAIALDYSGTPFVAWFESPSTDPDNKTRQLFVKTWTGTEWQALGETLNINPFEAVVLFSIAVGGNGRPVVAFSEFESLQNSSNVYVKRWTGTAWEQVGETLDFIKRQRAIYPTIVADAANGLSVAWWEGKTAEGSDLVIQNNIYFARWTGSDWQQLGEMNAATVSEGRYPDLALSGEGQRPALNWSENTSSIYVKLAQ